MSGRGTTSPLKDSVLASQDTEAYRYKQGDTVSYEFSEKGVLAGGRVTPDGMSNRHKNVRLP